MRLRDRFECLFANPAGTVQPNEPVRGGAEDQRRLGTPRVRIRVHEFPAPEQAARVEQGCADGIGRLIDVGAGKQRYPGVERPVGTDRLAYLQIVLLTEVEVLLAV